MNDTAKTEAAATHSFYEQMLEAYKNMGAYAVEISLVDGTKFKLLLEDLYIYLGNHVYIPGFAIGSRNTDEGLRYYYKHDRYYYYNQAKEKKVVPENNFMDIILEEIKDFKNSRDFCSDYDFPSSKEIYTFMFRNFYPNNNDIYKRWSKASYRIINNFVMVDKAIFDVNGEDNYCDYDISIDAKVPTRDCELNFCFNSDCIVSIKPYSHPLIDVRRISDQDFMEAAKECVETRKKQ